MSAAPPVRVSIVTVCWNDLENVQRTLDSLARQTERRGWEHVLIDGASIDGTVEWYQSAEFAFPHVVTSEPDNGLFDAMNKSLDIVKGEYVVFMNAGDCFADEDALGRILSRVESSLAWGYSRARVVDSTGRKVRPNVGKIPYSRAKHLLGGATICHQAVIMKVELLRDLGGFDLSMGDVADYHLLIKLAARIAPRTWPEIDVNYLDGGRSSVNPDLRGRHQARVDVLALTPITARFDSAWTAMQVARVRFRKKLKPLLGPIYLRLIK
ncbi:glycosyltransferase family 2 protein [Mycolicibacterium tusciae]|uniref:glycosyltransferase family 2 protein n=1 Tax=Mycolicibacterium tusciae TaxID=75922 RepID=UPI00024A4C21|nr:glycosyltransferase family 2 protein [Mycolicibacterium tusciae]